jgi:hypothetical protein
MIGPGGEGVRRISGKVQLQRVRIGGTAAPRPVLLYARYHFLPPCFRRGTAAGVRGYRLAGHSLAAGIVIYQD